MCASPINAFENFVHAQQDFRQELSRLTSNQAAFRPGAEQWSALQVIDHLIEVEKIIYTAARQNLRTATSADKLNPLHYIKYSIAMLILSTSRKIKTPDGVPEPQARKNVDSYLADWSKMRDRWKEFISEIGPEKNKLQAFVHPIAGPMTIGMTISFMASHIRHHLHQIDRLRKHPDMPER